MNKHVSKHPCPICQEMMWIVGITNKNEKITSCGHQFSFKKTRSQKEMDRKYVQTEYGLELRK